MRDSLIDYINRLFEGTVYTQKTLDFRDELLQNTLDRYDEELSAGKSEQEAYQIAVQSLGNPDELLRPFRQRSGGSTVLKTIAIVLYCTCFVPIILLSIGGGQYATFGVGLMFLILAAATAMIMLSGEAKPTENAELARKLRAAGVAVIVGSIAPIMFGTALWRENGAILGVCGMFLMIGGGVALLITAAQRAKLDAPAEPRAVPQQPIREQSRTAPVQSPMPAAKESNRIPTWVAIVGGILTGVYWTAATIAYVWLTVTTGAWMYSWVIFVIAGGAYAILRGIVLLCCGLRRYELIINGCLQLLACWGFYQITMRTGLWYVAWLTFPIAGCLTGVIGGIIELVRANRKEDEANA